MNLPAHSGYNNKVMEFGVKSKMAETDNMETGASVSGDASELVNPNNATLDKPSDGGSGGAPKKDNYVPANCEFREGRRRNGPLLLLLLSLAFSWPFPWLSCGANPL